MLTRGAAAGRFIYIEIQCSRTPVPVAFDVILRAGEQEWAGPSFHATPHQSAWLYEQMVLPSSDAQAVDVVLRASRGVAARTLTLTEIWDGEITIEQVPVR